MVVIAIIGKIGGARMKDVESKKQGPEMTTTVSATRNVIGNCLELTTDIAVNILCPVATALLT
jgi:hypothetical protein